MTPLRVRISSRFFVPRAQVAKDAKPEPGYLLRGLCSLGASLGLIAVVSAREIAFEKLTLTNEYWCDGVNAADINRDGHMDVIAGPFWYEGPTFQVRHTFYEPVPQALEANPTNSMFSFPFDFDGDGWVDILVLGRVLHHQAFWYKNPGKDGLTKPDARWEKFFVCNRVFGENPSFVDIDGDGKPEILALSGNTAEDKLKQWGWYAPDWSAPTKPWHFVAVTEKGDYNHYYHGEGVGDIDGDGRMDIVTNDGWWSQPPKAAPAGTRWTPHPFIFSHDKGGAEMLVFDVNGDGKNDVVTAINAHGWGLSWFEQTRDAKGAIGWIEHRMMGTRAEEKEFGVAFSQPHALTLADLDGDGLPDVITGKRRWAHGPTGDVEPMATPVNYVFKLTRDGKGGAKFTPQLIDDASALGVQVIAKDVNGDGVPDVLTASKLGVFVFITKRK